MQPIKIAFTKKYFPEQYHAEDYFIEYILEEGDRLCDAFKKAKEDTFIAFKGNNPQIVFNDIEVQHGDLEKIHALTGKRFYSEPPNHSNKELISMQEKETIPNNKSIEEQIQECTTLDALNEWKLLAQCTPKLKPIFEQRLFELSEPKQQQ